jgi:hypothetical protein
MNSLENCQKGWDFEKIMIYIINIDETDDSFYHGKYFS